MTTHLPYWSESDLAALEISAHEIIDMLKTLIQASENETVWSAPKAVITPPDGRYIMATLAVMSEPALVATKSLVLNERNSEQGLPQINSLVTLLHGETGVPLAIMDGNWITAQRTAGLSALAASYLAQPTARSVGFIGTGVQARNHLLLFAQQFPLQHVYIVGRGKRNIDLLAAQAQALNLDVTVCETAKQAVQNADLLVTSVTHTSVTEPFLDANWLSAGSFAASVDLAAPWHQTSFACLDKLIIDDLTQEASLPNKLANPADISGDLLGLVQAKVSPRQSAQERNIFAFRGHALGDLALAALAYQTFKVKEST